MNNNFELTSKNKCNKNAKVTVAFWLLIIPYIVLIASYAIISLSESDIVLAAVIAMILFPLLSICSSVASLVLQIISLCKHQTNNIIMLVFSILSILFTCFYVWFLIELGAAV